MRVSLHKSGILHTRPGWSRRHRVSHVPNAVSSAPARPTHTATQWHDPLEGRALMKIVGLGNRGANIVNRLTGTLHNADLQAEFWAVDSCTKSLSGCEPGVNTVLVGQDEDSSLNANDMGRLMGHGDGLTNAELYGADAGVAFVLGSALRSPGGASLILRLVNQFRRNGFFVVVALTKPFEFEGPRKLEQASCLVENMQDVANLVVTVEQDVLTKASRDMTMAQAVAISDNTLEHTVHSLLSALRAPEVLKLSNSSGLTASPRARLGVGSSTALALAGGTAPEAWSYLWHGRDLRQIPRLLFPPMMALLSCPGHGTLGRGKATIPASSLTTAGEASTFSTLAEDAVQAAAESPFLDGFMSGATAVLCILRVPIVEGAPGHGTRSGHTAAASFENHNIRSAAQVAAMTVRDLSGPQLTDIIVCVQPEPSNMDDAGHVCVEAALLVIGVVDEEASGMPATNARSDKLVSAVPTEMAPVPSAITAAARLQHGAVGAPTGTSGPAQGPQRMRSQASWSALSAIAGGSASAVAPASERGTTAVANEVGEVSAGKDTGGLSMAQVLQQIPRLADNLVTSLVAQSLDLPPSAATWRHQQKVPTQDKRTAYSLVAADVISEEKEDEDEKPSRGRAVDVRARAAGMLDRERA